ncbi:hypothetical protein [Methylovirgula sp. 4M-Z18]|uniref:hypothetical protein n=1 Tax=Methylovirgula sp. 4M-Z18 TaxID=2293567 RepID=UPI000E2F8E10|nr:hypothetical protein [Methylovirgula sp. 4M-Z18]RFB79728.1 hypothetical protein DYH55_09645 [Methylovirgula sp. 4M-Z18]
MPSRSLPTIPYFDARATGLAAHLHARAAAARALRDACLPLPAALMPVLTPLDLLMGRWLGRSASIYRREAAEMAAHLNFAGAMTINMSYQYGCTTGAGQGPDGAPLMRRSLDWPFHGLGRMVEVVHQRGAAGDFYNVTWPGAIGVLTALAPQRFAAAINQAPCVRRTPGAPLRGFDYAVNFHRTVTKETGWPPDHLLRYAFETCTDAEAAVDLLCREPVSRPVLFSLCAPHVQSCAVIERRERKACVYRGVFAVANDWQKPERAWEPRGEPYFDRRRDNAARHAAMQAALRASEQEFSWVKIPILNRNTRLAVEMSPASGTLLVLGYERATGGALPAAATGVFDLTTV